MLRSTQIWHLTLRTTVWAFAVSPRHPPRAKRYLAPNWGILSPLLFWETHRAQQFVPQRWDETLVHNKLEGFHEFPVWSCPVSFTLFRTFHIVTDSRECYEPQCRQRSQQSLLNRCDALTSSPILRIQLMPWMAKQGGWWWLSLS